MPYYSGAGVTSSPSSGAAGAIAFGSLTHRLQVVKLILKRESKLAMSKTAILRAMCGQIDTGRSRERTDSGFFRNSDVKKIPSAFALAAGRLDACIGGDKRLTREVHKFRCALSPPLKPPPDSPKLLSAPAPLPPARSKQSAPSA
jgi:hypothetical protein